MRLIQTVNFAITDRCNRACPNCCCRIPEIKDHWDCDLKYVWEVGRFLKGMKRITLTGGEPTLHPQLREIVGTLRQYVPFIQIETNGQSAKGDIDALLMFDCVYVSRCEDNEDDVGAIWKLLNGKAAVFVRDRVTNPHTPLDVRGHGPCERGTGEWVSIYKGRVYPCCMGWGIPGSESTTVISLPMSPTWVDEVVNIPLPCKNCLFGGTK